MDSIFTSTLSLNLINLVMKKLSSEKSQRSIVTTAINPQQKVCWVSSTGHKLCFSVFKAFVFTMGMCVYLCASPSLLRVLQFLGNGNTIRSLNLIIFFHKWITGAKRKERNPLPPKKKPYETPLATTQTQTNTEILFLCSVKAKFFTKVNLQCQRKLESKMCSLGVKGEEKIQEIVYAGHSSVIHNSNAAGYIFFSTCKVLCPLVQLVCNNTLKETRIKKTFLIELLKPSSLNLKKACRR